MTLKTPISVSPKTITEFTPVFQDDPANKRVTAFMRGMQRALVLWEGEAYDAVGQWTDVQAQARIQALADSGALAAAFA